MSVTDKHTTIVRLIKEKGKITVPVVVLVVALALLGLVSLGAAQGGRPLSAKLTGSAEVPPGDPDGSGTAKVRLNQGKGKISYEIKVSKITLPATAAHIHKGKAGVAGDPVVTLTPPDATGKSSGTVDADRELIKDIRQNPSNYYINVHNKDYPPGAVRGQLSK